MNLLWKFQTLWRRPRLIGLLFLACAMTVAWPSQGAREPETDEAAAAELTIMGHVFRVPKAYLTQAGDRAGRVIDYSGGAFFMVGILPDLRAPVGWEVKYYAGGDPLLETVRFQVWSRPGLAGPIEPYFKQETLRTCIGPRDGYWVCPHEFKLFKKREVLVRTGESLRLAFDCDKEGAYPNPLCEIILPLLNDVRLEVRFSREKMEFADTIIARVYELVCLFYRPEAGRKTTVNHCP